MPSTTVHEFDEVKALATRLDELVPSDGAIVVDASRSDGCYVVPTIQANRLGYMRLGIAFLKAAFVEWSDATQPYRIDPELHRIKGLEHVCYSFERREAVSLPETEVMPARSGLTAHLINAVAISFLVFVVASLVVGTVTLSRWLYGWILG